MNIIMMFQPAIIIFANVNLLIIYIDLVWLLENKPATIVFSNKVIGLHIPIAQ